MARMPTHVLTRRLRGGGGGCPARDCVMRLRCRSRADNDDFGRRGAAYGRHANAMLLLLLLLLCGGNGMQLTSCQLMCLPC